ncbi:MAG: hypothetical protein RIS94_1750 [Pseudomonadota bacterium]|jgi:AraC-like DNA-binding protein
MVTGSKKRLIRPDWTVPGVTSGIVGDVRLAGASLARFTLRDRGGFAMHGMPYLFVVLEGWCRAGLPDGREVELARGDALLALGGAETRLAVAGDLSACADMGEVWRANAGPPQSREGYERPVEIDWGEGAPGCVLLGSVMVLSHLATSLPIIAGLPPVAMLRRAETRLDAWTDGFARMLDAEAAQPSDGFAAVSGAGAQFLLAQLLRAHLAGHAPALADVLDAGRSRALAGLMRRLQRQPEEAWTLAGMARAAGMSRTRFAEYFGEVTGTTPFRYLAACRVDRACQLLLETDLPVAEIAGAVGYQSERAFRDVFVAARGVRPLAYRKAGRKVGRKAGAARPE